jgi:DHA1 family tetracycline resistance protein-like MFS transporter
MRGSPLVPLFLTVFVDVLAFSLMIPILPYYATHFGASPFVASSLVTVFAVCQLVSGPFLGRWSDKVGRKPVLLGSQVGTLVAFLLLAVADQLWMLFASRIVAGLTAGNLTIAQAYISDVTRPENRTKAYGLIGISFGIGFLVGPAVSGALAKSYGYSASATAASVLSAVAILTTVTLLPANPPRPPQDSPAAAPATSGAPPVRTSAAFWSYFERPATRPILLAFGGFLFAFSTLLGGLALFLQGSFGFDVGKTGLVFGMSGLVGALTQPLLGVLSRRLGEARMVQVGLGSMVVGYALLGVTRLEPVLYVITACTAFGSALVRPAATTLLTRSVERHEQGAALGASQFLQSLSQIAGPVVAGTLIDRKAYGAFGMAAATWALLGFVATLSLGRGAGAKPAPPTSASP